MENSLKKVASEVEENWDRGPEGRSFSGSLLTWVLHPYKNFTWRMGMAGAAFSRWRAEDGNTTPACCILWVTAYNIVQNNKSFRLMSK